MKKENLISVRKIIILTALFILFSFSCFAEAPPMVITTWCESPFSEPDQTGYFDQILKEAFKRAGCEITISRRPAERSLYEANTGTTDGDFVRVGKIGKIYPNLLIVPEDLYEMEFVAFTKKDDVKITNGWKGLEPYKVGIVKGWKILEENVTSSGQRSDAYTQENLFKILDAGRIDVAVYSKMFGCELIHQLGFKGIRYVEPPLAKEKMYLFLHKKHKNMIPKLADIFKAMKSEGIFLELREKTLLEKDNMATIMK